MRVSKALESYIPLPPQIKQAQSPAPVFPSHTNAQHKFKVLEKIFLNRTALKEMIKREQESTSIARRLNTLQKSEKSNASEYLISLKKAHDSINSKAAEREASTFQLKKEIDNIKKSLQIENVEVRNEKEQVDDLQSRYESIKQKQENCAMEGKTLQHILSRMKKDEIVHKKKITDLEGKALELKNMIRQTENKKMELNQFEGVSANVVKKAKDSYTHFTQKRRKDLEQYQKQIKKLKDGQRKQQERQRMTDEIQTLAATDVSDANMTKWKKLLFAELAFKKMLKFKVANLEVKYGKIKSAFHTIRFKTTVDDPAQLSSGYYQLEQSYLHLLEDVRHLEQKERKLQLEKQKLEQQYQNGHSRFYEIIQAKQARDQDEETILCRKAKEVCDQSVSIQLLEQKVYDWWFENMSKLTEIRHKQLPCKKLVLELYPIQKLGDYLVQYCEQLLQQHKHLRETERQNVVGWKDLQSLENVVHGFKRKKSENQETTQSQRMKKGKFRA